MDQNERQQLVNLMPDNRELIETLLQIRNKRGIRVPFLLNRAQRHYWENKTRRNLILKARQEGISKVIDADQLIDCIKKPTNAVVISHEQKATKRLFAAVRYFIDNMGVKPAMSIDSQYQITFPKTESSYFISTAGQKAAGRGDTVDRAHLSEAAFYGNLEAILAGVAEAAEYGQIDIETTPNGREEFYEMWERAKSGQSAYTPIFIPWFFNEDYDSTRMTEKEREGLSAAMQTLFNMSDEEFKTTITEEEQRLIDRVKREYGDDLTYGQLKWRRYKIWDKGQLFWQEYPEDDVSCFLQSGRSVFSVITTDITKRIPLDDIEPWIAAQKWEGETEEDKKKAIEQWRKRPLFAAVDGAEGTLTGDRHAFTVIDAPTSGKANVIFEYVSNEPIDIFWGRIAPILQQFNVNLGIEKNGVGIAHVRKAQELGLSYQEWDTTASTRPMMIVELEEAYRKEELIESYPEAENEARDMFYNQQNRPEHPAGKHDDRVFSRSIAWQMRKMPVARVSFV